MNKSELESKHLAELHALAAEAGVEGYRMLPRAELIEKLLGGKPGGEAKPPRERRREPRPRRGREERPRQGRREEKPRESRKRRRRWGRRRKGLRVTDLLLPAAPGRQAIVYAETRERCTALLRELAAELSGASKGPDPVALLIDPSPEELAEWRREAPQAEIVAAGQARHAGDALAQAARRANAGEDVVVLIDSLSRFAETFAGPDEARDLFDAGRTSTGGSLTVVAAVEQSG